MTTRLLLARHGAIDWSGQIGAPSDSLNDRGRRQAEALARRLATHDVAVIYSSPLPRAAQTAESVAGRLGLDIHWEPSLRERHLGDWEGRDEVEFKAKHPQEWQRLFMDPQFAPPGGESISQLRERMVAAASEIAASQTSRTVLLVSHGGAIASVVCHILGIDFLAMTRQWSDGRAPFALDHCGLSIVEFRQGGTVLTRLNDTTHVESLTGT